ncbi:anti-repressor SinI family protein [Bacillus sp. EAC]|nr:anti-repressor SinI family protein [Bacillus sp. EAC]
MQAELKEYNLEMSWTDLLLECIDAGITPEEVRSFLYNYIKDPCQI